MEWIVSNRRRELTIAGLIAAVAFSTVFLLTGAIMSQVYGLKPLDPGYTHYKDDITGIENTPYQDFMVNGCLTKQILPGDKIIILDTKGLEESGLFYYDPNYCFDVAKNTPGYIIDSIETYGDNNEQMKITMTKK